MKPSITLITLGVKDFQKSLAFYKDGLGWPAKVQDDIAFFQLNTLVFSIYPWEKLAEDATVSDKGNGFKGITLAHNVGSVEEVDATLKIVENLGAKIIKKAQKVFWGGYSGYFADPDGNLWEVAHNPFWKLNKDGSVNLT
jgi:catechol 2,3-dioxygenase-like lactoylglutathione lyase family enzyme